MALKASSFRDPAALLAYLKSRWQSFKSGFPKNLIELAYPILFAVALPLSHFISPTNLHLYVGEIKYVLLIYILIAIVVFGIVSTLLKTPAERLIATLALIFLFVEDFETRLEYFIPVFKVFVPVATPFEVLASAVFAVLCILFVVWIVRLVVRWLSKRVTWEQIYSAARILVVFVFVYNLLAFSIFLNGRMAAATFDPVHPSDVRIGNKPDRDIYYIVLDRYMGETGLRDNYGFDNSAFTEELERKGFYVRDPAFSNYQFSAPSIASTLSLDYNTQITEKLKNDKSESGLPYRKLINNPALYKYLREAGYSVNHIGSSWNLTRTQEADISSNPNFEMKFFGSKKILNEYESLVIEKSVLARFLKAGVFAGKTPVIHMASGSDRRSMLFSQMDSLRAFASQYNPDQPRFVFAHILSPHPNYVFTSDGDIPEYSEADDNQDLPRKDKYINQIKFLNNKIIQLVQDIKTSSKTEPIIILQSDEGQYPLEYKANRQLDWTKVKNETLKEKFNILAAYHLPGIEVGEQEKAQINSVNIFRFILNRYMGTNLEYLPDCTFVSISNNRFYEVTKQLHAPDDRCRNVH